MHPTTVVRERLLAKEMAAQLKMKLRAFYKLKTYGMPYTQVGGMVWYEPYKVQAWLDTFERTGTPGTRYKRHPAVLEPPRNKARSKVRRLSAKEVVA